MKKAVASLLAVSLLVVSAWAGNVPVKDGAGSDVYLKATGAGSDVDPYIPQHAVTQSGTWTVQPGNTANTTAWKVDGSAVTQPVSAASLPLPSGAATAAKQPALGTAGTASADVITVQGITSMTALKVDGSAVTQPVSGTFWQATQPVSGTVTVQQSTASNLKVDLSGTAANATAIKVDNSAVTQPVSGTVTANLAAGTNYVGKTRLTDGTNDISVQTAPSDGFGNTSNRIPVLSFGMGYNGSTWDRLRVDSSQNLLIQSTNPLTTGGVTKVISSSVTRPADTTAYASGDAVTNSTSAPTVITFSNMCRVSGGSGVIVGATLIDGANQATKGDFELYLFDTTFTPDNDNAVFTPTDTELETALGFISFSGSFAKSGDATSGAGGNAIYASSMSNPIPYVCGTTSVFGGLVVRNAYTPVSAEKFTVRLQVQQD